MAVSPTHRHEGKNEQDIVNWGILQDLWKGNILREEFHISQETGENFSDFFLFSKEEFQISLSFLNYLVFQH